ncbi:hypothetical protein THAOC_14242 [Thalassiosira oceanica]|uniref:Uncharacterized protein n=1 Tax=Thalassiosira oceanica TaxID=159749 RepID=K0SVD0_THAOC|nr:hypothetical protein THAOC_14242 [Thalassiosira oceanica]|eukprot:EJK64966.1 hypothetical protein THAOC_14242 [Thalassiosira oceanica]
MKHPTLVYPLSQCLSINPSNQCFRAPVLLETNHELPDEYPTKLVIEAVSLVMRNNIFEFGDCTFKQLIGSAMGTPVAVQTATIYYAYHEITVLIPKYGRHLQYYGRFINDATGAWNDLDDPEAFGRICEDVNNLLGHLKMGS